VDKTGGVYLTMKKKKKEKFWSRLTKTKPVHFVPYRFVLCAHICSEGH